MLSWGLDRLLDDPLAMLVVSCLLCGIIGLEREYRQKAAGFRTHLLVGLGSTLFTLISIHGFGIADESRVAAQIVSGIGFIGGGAILRHGFSVRGVTTAATLWLVAAIGMAVGVGWYEPALVATAMALLTLLLLSRIERFLPTLPTALVVQLRLTVAPETQRAVRDRLEEGGWVVRRGHVERAQPEHLRLAFMIRHEAGTEQDLEALLASLQALSGLQEISWGVLET